MHKASKILLGYDLLSDRACEHVLLMALSELGSMEKEWTMQDKNNMEEQEWTRKNKNEQQWTRKNSKEQ